MYKERASYARPLGQKKDRPLPGERTREDKLPLTGTGGTGMVRRMLQVWEQPEQRQKDRWARKDVRETGSRTI